MSKTVFISGNFNVLHPGHIRLFKYAREMGDELVVGVFSDRLAGEHAYINENHRLEGVLNQVLVSKAYLINEPIQNFLLTIRPNIVLKGKEFELANNPESITISQYGGKLLFSSGESDFTSIELINKNAHQFVDSSIQLPNDYKSVYGFESKKLTTIIEKFKALKVCIIGDLIVDEYIACEPIGMSQEDPTIVVSPIANERFLGGAGIVASHASGLGASSHFIGFTGDDQLKDYIVSKFNENNVNAILHVDDSRPTTLKTRFRANGKTLLRVNHFHKSFISKDLQEKILKDFEVNSGNFDALIFSDFNHGCLPIDLIEKLKKVASSRGMVIAADSQSSSQIGDISRFTGLDLLTPTEREARLALRDQDSGLVVLAEKLKSLTRAKNVLLKMGAEGALLVGNVNDSLGQAAQVPALNVMPLDVSGAGDSMLIATVLALTSGANFYDAALIGSIVAAIQVGRLGNIPLKKEEVISIIRRL